MATAAVENATAVIATEAAPRGWRHGTVDPDQPMGAEGLIAIGPWPGYRCCPGEHQQEQVERLVFGVSPGVRVGELGDPVNTKRRRGVLLGWANTKPAVAERGSAGPDTAKSAPHIV